MAHYVFTKVDCFLSWHVTNLRGTYSTHGRIIKKSAIYEIKKNFYFFHIPLPDHFPNLDLFIQVLFIYLQSFTTLPLTVKIVGEIVVPFELENAVSNYPL